ncbi:MAG: ribonuclease J [Clostridiales bacterium]|nr:ribonuclease J [Clostridiales bacterium]
MFLGGIGEIGKNMAALQYKDEIIIVDCGMTFPSVDMPGVDLVIPDFTYLVNNHSKIKGIILTHGHEDHIGAMPYLLRDIKAPVFGTNITLALVEGRLRENKMEGFVLNTVRPKSVISLGNSFKVEFIHVNHSIPGSCALSITTPVGIVFFTGDFKVDFTPIGGVPTDLVRIAEIGQKGVLCMLSDSTNIERLGISMSETSVGRALNNIFLDNLDRRLIIATFSSNIHRIQQILDLAKKHKRRVAFRGRSMLNVADIASKIGELKYDKNILVDIDQIKDISDNNLVIVTTGSQGEPMSALTRMSNDEFNKVMIGAMDTIVISASPIPGNERMINTVINNLYRKGAKVIYESFAEVHASGHGYQDELKLVLSLVKPKFFIPVHGEPRHLKKHAEVAMSMGMSPQHIYIGDLGDCIEFDSRTMRLGDKIVAGAVLVDGLGVGDVGQVVLRDRKHLSEDGLFVVVLGIDTRSQEITACEVTSRGFVYMKETEELIDEAKDVVMQVYSRLDQKDLADWNLLKNIIRKELKTYLFSKTRRNPMILSMILEN